ncbi:C-terminal processing protease CtpA/Prc [Flavobacterium sp. 90]|uniref:S41 family peptidase n=2 Tax=unclassified Flavobacterium TaxID=196869 RepID=UPI000EB439A0|nr:S41 family peptidase [Flavobacterium sp. 90]RKR05123.1 C-terminal processing protease CtpA/Prc [Flavobacterium sp. 81]TCK56438.1 C-terminal processing protease CtpA/Prc [Flavobacterium sp. 90]
MTKHFLMLFILGSLFCSCSKDDNFQSAADSHTVLLDSSFIISKEMYLWNTGIKDNKDFNPSHFKTPLELLIEFRKYSPKNDQGLPIDNWSFAIEKETWNNLLQGSSNDFGCSFRFKDSQDLRISAVQQNSFAHKNGLYRGLQVLSINDIKATIANIDLISKEFNTNTKLSIVYFDKETQVNKTLIISKEPYVLEPVMANNYFDVNNKKVGYLNISTFINSLNNKLPVIFDDFKANAVEVLIIDLRYNGGGLTSVMENLANMLIPSGAVGKTMYTTKHNTDYAMFDSTTFFSASDQRLDLKTIYFIVSHNTASSSEMLINAIKPYTNTILIGEETQGKLVGMYTVPFHNYILAPVSFKTYNAKDESLEKNGFIPNYYKEDDVANDFDQNEGCISAALYHYKNNVFPTSKSKLRIEAKQEIVLIHNTLPFAIKDKTF